MEGGGPEEQGINKGSNKASAKSTDPSILSSPSSNENERLASPPTQRRKARLSREQQCTAPQGGRRGAGGGFFRDGLNTHTHT